MTPTQTLYGRQVLVRLIPPDGDARELRGLRVTWSSKKSTSSTPATATIKIYNPAPDSIAAMQSSKSVVELWAGYSGLDPNGHLDPTRVGALKLVWRGNPIPFGVKSEYVSPNRILTVEASDGGAVSSSSFVSIAFATQTTPGQIVAEALRQTGIPADTVDYPKTPVYPNGFRFQGRAIDLFGQLASLTGNAWYLRDGALIFAAGDTAAGEVVLISANTGMIGSPTPKSDGSVEVKCLLDTGARVGGLIEVQSLYVNGVYKVQTASTEGDSWEGPFDTTFTAIKQG